MSWNHANYRPNYPRTVAEVLRDRRYNPDALRALKAYRRSKPWQGTPAEQRQKLNALHAELCRVYALRTSLVFGSDDCYSRLGDRITLSRVSVVTYLHELAHARGADERQACGWSINLFRRVFPRSYASLQHVGHTLRRSDRTPRTDAATTTAAAPLVYRVGRRRRAPRPTL